MDYAAAPDVTPYLRPKLSIAVIPLRLVAS
jgi:hypothetical protein